MNFSKLKIGDNYLAHDSVWKPLGKVKLLDIEKIVEDTLGRPRRKCRAEVLAALDDDWKGAGEVAYFPMSALSVWDEYNEIRLRLKSAINEGETASVMLERHQWELLLEQLDCQDGYSW